MHLSKYTLLFILSFLILNVFANSDSAHDYADSRDSGGKPVAGQEKYDVGFYDLHLRVDPDNKWIGGYLEMKATAIEDLEVIVIHLDTLLQINKVEIDELILASSELNRKEGLVYIETGNIYKPGDKFKIKIHYQGYPLWVKNATRTPFKDGFYFEKTENSQHWVGVVSVLTGADVWWPCKDVPSDEPDSMGIHIRTNQDLVVASNGKLMGIEKHDDSTHTYHWFVSYPINNYGVTVNIAPYKTIRTNIESVSGKEFPFEVYVLPENYEQAKEYFPFMLRDLKFLEELLGPFPFFRDKSAIAQTFYIGMETQSIIAFGSDFENRSYGFNFVHLHELAHEWFANMVTADDWKHMWIHEGFVTYIEALYAEYLNGIEGYRNYMNWRMSQISYDRPIILKGKYVPIRDAYHMDIYYKGAAVLHTLRFLIGKDLMIESLRRFAYPDPALEMMKDNSHIRFSDTDEYIQIVEKLSGKKLDWFFDANLYYARSPRLQIQQLDKTIQLTWETSSDYTYKLPVPVMIDGSYRIIPMNDGTGSFNVIDNYTIDPYFEILHYRIRVSDLIAKKLETNGYEDAINLHRSLILNKPDSVYLRETYLNRLGYRYLSAGELKNARVVFQMNIDAYPDSPNCYDSMGDAYKQSGNLGKAREFFRKAVEIAIKTEDSQLQLYQARLEEINNLIEENR